MRVVVLKDNKLKIKEIGTDFQELQKLVGGCFEIPYISKTLAENNIDIVINEDGKFMEELKPEITVLDNDNNIVDVIYGNCVFTSHEGEETTGLSDEQIEVLSELMRLNVMLRVDDQNIVTKAVRYQ